MAKQRLDVLLVERGLCETRQWAQRLIRAGEVQVNHQVVDKPGTAIALDAELLVKPQARFVSRGGDKLAKALEAFDIDVAGRVCLDGGISTGGFTDCLLQAGAAKVYGIDVGYGQVAWKLRQDARVVLRERTNLRHLTPEDLYRNELVRPDLGVMDVSFISLTKVLPAVWQLLTAHREAVLLVKPQFEVGREKNWQERRGAIAPRPGRGHLASFASGASVGLARSRSDVLPHRRPRREYRVSPMAADGYRGSNCRSIAHARSNVGHHQTGPRAIGLSLLMASRLPS